MKKINGFTLIELLAVIIILAVVLVIAVPKINNVIEDEKKQSFFLSAKAILRNVDYDNIENNSMEKTSLASLNLNNLSNEDYDINNSYVYMIDNVLYIDLAGINKYANILLCHVAKNDKIFRNYSQCQPINISLTVNLDNGIIEDNPEGEYPINAIIDLGVPTKENYDFAGWEKISGTSALSVNSLVMGDEDTVVKALWTPRPYTITYTLSGGNASNPTEYNVESDSITLTNPTKPGYDFAGWTGSNGTTKQTTVTIPNRSTGNKSYTANWTRITYKIIYTLDDGTASNPTEYNVESDSITLTNPTKAGYDFAGWTGSNGTTAQPTVTIPNGSTGNKSYTANWIPLTYTITYNCNGGQGSTASTTFVYGNTTILTANGCNKIITGSAGGVYYFKGWAKSSTATSVLFTDKQNITNSAQITSNTTLYALWDTLFTITGNYEVINDNNNNWRVKIKGSVGNTSGDATITFKITTAIDAFLVGGGGGGSYSFFPSGGGGGYTRTYPNISMKANTPIDVTIGAGGDYGSPNTQYNGNSGQPSYLGTYSAPGGGGASSNNGGDGGSGGGSWTGVNFAGASDGGSDGSGSGVGQGSTTREFGEPDGTLYAGGGASGDDKAGGDGGGGDSGNPGGTNLGGGGGGYYADGRGSGGSGIVVIRNHR